ncbi:NAD(P)-dependent alcohol dehydrogenase [Xylanimonas sp. McL0601]|uniref:NAD(P)-dependent alcohol dehydrogenase n=1 Tax=Xylanimonas sp. McL0601 TaxID=3414739 RepID=UPI003CFA7324
MRAIRQYGFGEPRDVLRFETDVVEPTPAEDEVLVRVGAAGVDYGQWHLVAGVPLMVRAAVRVSEDRPRTVGLDFAGTVEATGAAVTGFAPGDAVFGVAASGAYADLTVARVRKIARTPASLSPTAAAVVPISGSTALQAVRDVARVRAGQRVLVFGAAGGVGSYAVQLAKHFGAHVTGVCRGASADFVRSLGADETIDFETSETSLDGHQWDAVIETGGVRTLRRARSLLTRHGVLVPVGGEAPGRPFFGIGRVLRATLWSPFVPQRLRMFIASTKADDLQTLADLLAQGAITAHVDRVFPLEQGAAAIEALRAGGVRGKLAVHVAP